MPLPGGITPGEYRVVRSDGRVLELRLTAAELFRRGIPQSEPSRSHYLLHDGRIRWYFIRVETAKTEIVNRPAPVVRNLFRTIGGSCGMPLFNEKWGALRYVPLGQLHSGWDALQAAARQAIADLARRSKIAFASAVDQLRQAAVSMRRVASPDVRSDRLQPVKGPAEAGHYERAARR